jgi:hypothetical protein
MRVAFSSSNQLGSWLLRTVLFSEWSHCGVVVGDYVIEATMFRGVVATPLEEFKRDRKWAIVEFPVEDEEAAIKALYKEIGKKYDWLGLLGMPFIRRWHSTDNWFCSELTAYVLKEGGLSCFRYPQYRITPRDLWNLPFPIIEHYNLEVD